MSEVKHLEINYKTDELFEAFREFGNKDLYMVEELQGQMMRCQFWITILWHLSRWKPCCPNGFTKKGDVEEIYFPEFDDYLLLWKLEVLDNYKNKGYGQSLIDYAKSYNMPIKAIARQNSKEFLMNQDFEDVHAKNPEGHDVLVWAPK